MLHNNDTKCRMPAAAKLPVGKSHQDHQGSQSEQLRTLVTF